MEEADKVWLMIRIGVSGWMFILVPTYRGCPWQNPESRKMVVCVCVFSLLYLLTWHPPLHTPYISSPNHCLLFAAHAHTIATCFAVVPRLCHLILVSLSTLYLEFCLVVSRHTYIGILHCIQYTYCCVCRLVVWTGVKWETEVLTSC